MEIGGSSVCIEQMMDSNCIPSVNDNNRVQLIEGPFLGVLSSVTSIPFDAKYHRNWFEDNWKFSLYASVIYFALVYYGQLWMNKQKPLSIRGLLVSWNIGLAIFSFFGTVNLLPELVNSVSKGFHHSVCNSSWVNSKRMEFWIWLFTWSKLIEFGDTAFIVLRKQKLILLHLIHHPLTFVYCFYIYSVTPATSRWGMSINYGIHAVMYTYYGIRAMRFNPPKFVAMIITLLQIIQMMVGVITGGGAAYYILTDDRICHATLGTAVATFSMSGLYFILFINFFLKTYAFKQIKNKTT